MLSSQSIARNTKAIRKQQELAELVRLYDAAESYDEFQANRDIHGLHDSNKILGFIDPFKVIYFLENHPRVSLSYIYFATLAILPIAFSLFLACCKPGPTLSIIAIVVTFAASFSPVIANMLLDKPLSAIRHMSTTIHSPNIPS